MSSLFSVQTCLIVLVYPVSFPKVPKNSYPVSYTHLDVYKRQVLSSPSAFLSWDGKFCCLLSLSLTLKTLLSIIRLRHSSPLNSDSFIRFCLLSSPPSTLPNILLSNPYLLCYQCLPSLRYSILCTFSLSFCFYSLYTHSQFLLYSCLSHKSFL